MRYGEGLLITVSIWGVVKEVLIRKNKSNISFSV